MKRTKTIRLILTFVFILLIACIPTASAIAQDGLLIAEEPVAYGAEAEDHVTVTSRSAESSQFGKLFTWRIKNNLGKDTVVKLFASKNGHNSYSKITEFTSKKGATKVVSYDVNKGRYIRVDTKQENGEYRSKVYEVSQENITLADAQTTSVRSVASIFGEKFTWRIKNATSKKTRIIVYASRNQNNGYSKIAEFDLNNGATKVITYDVSRGEYIRVNTRQGDGNYNVQQYKVAQSSIDLSHAQTVSQASSASDFGEKYTWKIKNATDKDTRVRVYASKNENNGYNKVTEFDLNHGATKTITYDVSKGKYLRVETRQGNGEYITKTYMTSQDNITVADVVATSQSAAANVFGEKFAWKLKNTTSKDTRVRVYTSKNENNGFNKVTEFDLNHGVAKDITYDVSRGKYLRVETRQGDGSYRSATYQVAQNNITLQGVATTSQSAAANVFGEKFAWKLKNTTSKDTRVRVYASNNENNGYNKIAEFDLNHGVAKDVTYDVSRGRYVKIETRQGDGTYQTAIYNVAQENITLAGVKSTSQSAAANIFGEKFAWKLKNTTSKDTRVLVYASKNENNGFNKISEFDLIHGVAKDITYDVSRGGYIKVETRQGDGTYVSAVYNVAQDNITLKDAQTTSVRSDNNNFAKKYTWKFKNTTSKDTRIRLYTSKNENNGYNKLAEFDLNHGAVATKLYDIARGKYIKVETRQGDGTYSAVVYKVADSSIAYDAVQVTPVEVTGSDTIEWKIKNTGDRDTNIIVTANAGNSPVIDQFDLKKGKVNTVQDSLANARVIGVKVRQGDGSYKMTRYEATVANVTVNIDPLSGHAWVYRNGRLVDEKDVDKTRTFTTLEGNVDIKVEVNGQVNWYRDINATGNITLDSANATINYPGVTRVNTVKITSSTGQVYRRDWTSNGVSFYGLKNGIYTVEAYKGGMVYRREGVVLIGGAVHDIPLTTLKVTYPGVSRVNTTIIKVGNSNVTRNDWQTDETSFTLFRGIEYNLTVQKGGMIHTASVNCNKPNVRYDVPLTKVDVNFPGVSRVNMTSIKVGNSNVMRNDWQTDSTSFILFRDIEYNLTVQKGGMVHNATINCDEATETYDVPLTKLTVNFPGVNRVNMTNIAVGDSNVMRNDWQTDSTSFILFKDIEYNLTLQKGGMIHNATVNCDQATETYDVPLTTLTVNFPNVTRVNMTNVSVGGLNVMRNDWQSNSTSFVLFRGIEYDLTLQKGTMIHTGKINCDEQTETYNVPICHVTVLFDGFRASTTAIGISGSDVTRNDWKTGSSEFYVFQDNPYYVRLVIDGKEYRYDPVDCRTDEVVLGKSTLDVQYPNVYANVKVYRQDGSLAKSIGHRWHGASCDLPNGLYDVVITQGSTSTRIEDFMVLGSTNMISDLVCAVTIDHDKVYASAKITNDAGNIASAGHSWNTKTLYVLKSEEQRDVTINQGSTTKVIEDQVFNTDAVTIGDLVCVVTIDHNKVYASAKITNDTGTITNAGHGWHTKTLYVLKSDEQRDVTINQGTATKVVEDQVFNTNTATIGDLVCAVTINYDKVYASAKITNDAGTIASAGHCWDQNTLYVLKSTQQRDVVLKQGNTTKVVEDKVFNTNAETIGDLVSAVTINYNGVYASTKIANGSGLVASHGHTWNGATIYVLKSAEQRFVTVTQGSSVVNLPGQAFTENTHTIDGLVSDVTLNFNGIYANAVMKNGSGNIVSHGHTWNQIVLKALKSAETRSLAIKQGAETKVISPIVVNGSTTVNDLVCQVTVNFEGEYASTKISNGSGNVVTSGHRHNKAVLYVLRKNSSSEKYIVTINIGGTQHVLDVSGADFSAAATEVTYTPPAPPAGAPIDEGSAPDTETQG